MIPKFSLWGASIDSLFNLDYSRFLTPPGYVLNEKKQSDAILCRIYNKDSIPELIKSSLKIVLENKIGNNSFDIINFERCDFLDDSYIIAYGGQKFSNTIFDTLFNVWLKYHKPIAGNSHYIFCLRFNSKGKLINTFQFPSIKKDSTKANILTLNEVLGIITYSINNKKLIVLKDCSLSYDEKLDCMVWKILYREKRLRLIKRWKNNRSKIINAHSGEILKESFISIMPRFF